MPLQPGDKKHPATPQRRQRARQEGQVSKSADLSSALMLMVALLCLRWLGEPLCQRVATGLRESLSHAAVASWSLQDATQHLLRTAALFALATVPILSLMFLAGIVVNVMQTGLLLTSPAVAFKPQHLSPLAGAKRIASIRGLMRLGFGIFKVLVIAAVAYAAVRSRQEAIITLWAQPLPVLATALFENLMEICLWIAAALLCLGVVEYGFQRWRYEEDLKMTDQELRAEMKELQGDPQLQAQRKELRQRLATQPATQAIAGADVVIAGPDPIALAIVYRPQEMVAPVVVARAAGAHAQRLCQTASEHGVTVMQRPSLARFLAATTGVGGTIPADQYQAVADVLREVYQQRPAS